MNDCWIPFPYTLSNPFPLFLASTPHLSGFVVRCSSGILLIDTGISRAYGGEQSALIFDMQLKPVGGGTWEEEETISALYRGRRPRVIEKRIRKVESNGSIRGSSSSKS
jgi:hypothetical protein